MTLVKSTLLLALFMVPFCADISIVNGLSCTDDCSVGTVSRMESEGIMAAKAKHFAAKGEEALPVPSGIVKGEMMPCVNNLAGGFFPCKNIDLLSHTSLGEMSLGAIGSDIWGWTDNDTGHEYAIYGAKNGTSFVDITDPVFPIVIATLPTTVGSSYWRDIKVHNDTAFIVADNIGPHGMQIFDLRRLRELQNESSEDLVILEPDNIYAEFRESHNLFINEETGFAMAVGSNTCLGGIHLMDLRSDRLNPEFVGCWQEDGYVHDIQCVVYNGPDQNFAGNEICACFNEDEIVIIDISDKTVQGTTLTNIEIISRFSYEGMRYTHQGWFTEDFKFLLTNDESEAHTVGSRTYCFDVESLSSPVLIDIYETPSTVIDHNLYIRDNYSYMSNYAAGLRVRDVAGLYSGKSLEEVAYFDCWPDGDTRTWDGVWSSYIYFPSGNIIIGSQEYGLLVTRIAFVDDENVDDKNDPGQDSDSLNEYLSIVAIGVVVIACGFLLVAKVFSKKEDQSKNALVPAHDL